MSRNQQPPQAPPGRVVNMEEQLILRVPQPVADHIRKMLRAKQFTEDIEFKFADGSRDAEFRMGNKFYQAALVDLPCIVEAHKTLDKTTYYKSADIGQMLVVKDQDTQIPQDYRATSGLNPPTRDIRRRKWRKSLDRGKMEEIEHEVLRLLKPSDNETIEIINPDDDEISELTSTVETTPAPKEKERVDNKNKPNIKEDAPQEPSHKRDKKSTKKERSKKAEAPNQDVGEEKDAGQKEKKKKSKTSKPKKAHTSDSEKDKKHKKKKHKPSEPEAETGASATATPSTFSSPPVAASPPLMAISSPPTFILPPPAMPIPFAVQPPSISPVVSILRTQPADVIPIPPVTQPIPMAPVHTTSAALTAVVPPTLPTLAPIQSSIPKPTTPATPPKVESPPQPQTIAPENAALLQQHKKTLAEVAVLKAKVASIEANVNLAPNPIIKARAATKLAEANDALKAKLDELAGIEVKLGTI